MASTQGIGVPKRLLMALAIAGFGVLLNPAGAAAATVIGQNQGTAGCSGGLGMDTVQTASSGPSYAVPAGDWQITDWSTQAPAAQDGTLALEVWRPTPTAGSYTLVDISTAQPVAAGSGPSTFTLAPPIAVRAGDLLGLRITGGVGCNFTGDFTGDSYGILTSSAPPAPGSATAFAFAQHGFELDVAATLDAAAPPPPPPAPTPTAKTDCMKDGWQQLTDAGGTSFKNEGDCVSYVATQGSNTAG